jgi:hypothetical protein
MIPTYLVRLTGVVLVVSGVVVSKYNSFCYTKDTRNVMLGTIELSIKDKQIVEIPIWLSIGVIVMGSILLLYGYKKN